MEDTGGLGIVGGVGVEEDSSASLVDQGLPDSKTLACERLSANGIEPCSNILFDDPLGVTAVGRPSSEPEDRTVDLRDVETSKDQPEPQTGAASQKKGLRVTFPEDNNVVSGYMDPPTPWHSASECSTDDLISAYQNACEKIGVKPMPKLLNQLQVITNFEERNETLTLKNDHLDSKHCETLEEVFRRVQFRTIDIEATRLDEEAAVTFFDMAEYYEACLKLNISYNKNIGHRGWQACARMLRKTSCLEHLEARGCSITEQVMPFIGRALRMGSSLTNLHLENTVMSGRPLMILVAALKMNEVLKELYLADNKLMPSDGIQLGSLLKYNRMLQLLDLRSNHLQDVGIGHICDGIWEQTTGSGLRTLVVWNNQLTYQSMSALSRALMNTKSLETINLGHNHVTNEGIHRLKEGLLQNKSLLRIGLQAAKISCEGAVALAEFIAESVRLLRLDLRENEIKTGGLMALALSLKVNQSVTRVDVDKDPKKESGVKDYADQQKRLLNDISTYVDRNHKLARQREEDEFAKDMIESITISASGDENGGDNPESPNMETAPQEGQLFETTMETNREMSEEMENTLNADINQEQKQESESPRRRLSLNFDETRSQTLESPAFVMESQMQDFAPPVERVMPTDEEMLVDLMAKRKAPITIPPSPMVLSHGMACLIPVYEDPLSPNESNITNITSENERKFVTQLSNISDVVEEASEQSSSDVDCVSPPSTPVASIYGNVESQSSPTNTNKKGGGGKSTKAKRKFTVTKATLHHRPNIYSTTRKSSLTSSHKSPAGRDVDGSSRKHSNTDTVAMAVEQVQSLSSIHQVAHSPSSTNHQMAHFPSTNHQMAHSPSSTNHQMAHSPSSTNHQMAHSPSSTNHQMAVGRVHSPPSNHQMAVEQVQSSSSSHQMAIEPDLSSSSNPQTAASVINTSPISLAEFSFSSKLPDGNKMSPLVQLNLTSESADPVIGSSSVLDSKSTVCNPHVDNQIDDQNVNIDRVCQSVVCHSPTEVSFDLLNFEDQSTTPVDQKDIVSNLKDLGNIVSESNIVGCDNDELSCDKDWGTTRDCAIEDFVNGEKLYANCGNGLKPELSHVLNTIDSRISDVDSNFLDKVNTSSEPDVNMKAM